MKQKLREFWYNYKKEILFILILFLVSTISFALGYLSAKEFNKTPIIIQKINNE
ncbi:MAG: hypothetical protein RMK17_02520 [bacterium]|nr:hypothetical protein [Patescibacteria group bacterium]MDW8280008.1 hypothetical protein [bacterium]